MGIVIPWGLNAEDIPDGFQICDGTNDAPDLTDRFIKSASNNQSGATGGSSEHSHTVESGGGSHRHSTNNADSHYHYCDGSSAGSASDFRDYYDAGCRTDSKSHDHGYVGYDGSSHTHTVETDASNIPECFVLIFLHTEQRIHVPHNSVVMFHGHIDDIPTGYELCDGENGNPDLQGRFIKGANDSDEIGNTGGSQSHSHSLSNDGAHSHETDSESGSHSHANSDTEGGGLSDGNDVLTGVDGGNHTHSTSSAGSHTHDVSDENHEPPFYELCFIIRKERAA